ncbi:MAG: TerC family protein [Deltaproteobacteria bacterium]|nr:TerC family protein [Deltaproteobacteria bacterium]
MGYGLGSAPLWIGFGLLIAALLIIDLGVFNRRSHVVSTREAALWTGVWVAISLLFNAFVVWRLGLAAGEEFLTAYAVEKALAVDNLFVFYAVFTAFSVPREHQHRVLFWGILGAIVMRTVMVFAGVSLLARFHWLVFIFGAVLIVTGVKMMKRHDDRPHVENSRLLRLLKRIIPSTDEVHGRRFFVKLDGAWKATPLFLALLFLEGTDAVFAVDSIFAIFAITLDPFILLTSNIFAVLGMRSLYFVLSSAANRFAYVQPGLALVLVFVGVKMMAADWIKIPVLVSLGIVAALVGGSILLSMWHRRAEAPVAQPG